MAGWALDGLPALLGFSTVAIPDTMALTGLNFHFIPRWFLKDMKNMEPNVLLSSVLLSSVPCQVLL